MRRLTARTEQLTQAIIEAAQEASLEGVIVDPAMIVSSDDPIAIATSLFIYGDAYIGQGTEVTADARRLISELANLTKSPTP